MRKIHLTLIRRELVLWAIKNEMVITESNNESFICEDDFSILDVSVPDVLESVRNGWSVNEKCQNEVCCKPEVDAS